MRTGRLAGRWQRDTMMGVFTKNGAGERSRTPDRLITSQLLYQLSYASIFIEVTF